MFEAPLAVAVNRNGLQQNPTLSHFDTTIRRFRMDDQGAGGQPLTSTVSDPTVVVASDRSEAGHPLWGRTRAPSGTA